MKRVRPMVISKLAVKTTRPSTIMSKLMAMSTKPMVILPGSTGCFFLEFEKFLSAKRGQWGFDFYT